LTSPIFFQISDLRSFRRAAAVCITALLLFGTPGLAQTTYLVDTGQPTGTSIGSAALFGTGSTSCSPVPACQSNFQYLAAQFTLPEAASLSSIELWIVQFSSGGAMDVKIRENVNGLPSTSAPPLFSPNSIYSKRYTGLPNVFSGGQWIQFPQYSAVLPAGTYWVTFEPVAGSQLNYTAAKGAPNPLAKYAFYGNGNPGYLALPQTQAFGVRIAGTTFPGLAFGTATRVTSQGSFFSGVGPFNIDAVQEGTRAFVPNGVTGAALTSSYIFELGVSHIHARGKLFANGLSAGAYASTSTAIGAGRGVAYRTYMNMGTAAETFQINAILDGAFFRAGGLARAGVYAFDTALFSSTITGSGKTAGHFLLDSDGLGALGTSTHSISLARLFPSAAVLTSNEVAPSFGTGTVQSVPLQAGPITLQPGETVTILFDVTTYAPTNGELNFSNTLKPAPIFFTDLGGQPSIHIVGVGPSSDVTGTPTAIALAPVWASTPLGNTHAATATVTGAGNTPIVDGAVTFSIASGPNSPFTITVNTDGNGEAAFTYGGVSLGTDAIQATIGALSASPAANTWIAGPLDHIVVTPASATLPVGSSQAFTVEAWDGFGNSLGDVTSTAAFGITPDGSCTGASCTAISAGSHTVTASYSGKTATATLTFTGGGGFAFSGFFSPVDDPPVVNVVKAGSAIPVKFSLGGDQGLSIFAAGSPFSQPIACEAGALDDVEETTTAGASQLSYDPLTGVYTYVWRSEKSWGNSCRQLTVTLSDGSIHIAKFRFK
jgi:hypothetical protein